MLFRNVLNNNFDYIYVFNSLTLKIMAIIFLALICGVFVFLIFRGLSLLVFKPEKPNKHPINISNKYIERHKEILNQYDEYYEYVYWCQKNNQDYILDFNMFTVLKST